MDPRDDDTAAPLLADAEHARAPPPRPTPLPAAQLGALCTVRLVEPIAFTQIFPYVNEYMRALRLTDDPRQIGFYSGLVESTFALAQLCSIYQWARVSDVVGRRPCILVGILGLAFATAMFGLAGSLPAVLLVRTLAGLFSGNVAVIHSVLGELTDASNQALAFPIYGLFWPIGAIIGPLLGGTLSNPATKFPTYFSGAIWVRHPYFLPGLVSAMIAVAGAIFGFFFLHETLPSKTRAGEKAPAKPHGIRTLLGNPAIRSLCASGFALSFIATGFEVIFVLFCYSPVAAGGLAFSPAQIGYALAGAGTIAAAIQLLVLPALLRRHSAARVYTFCMSLWPFAFACLPLLNAAARAGAGRAAQWAGIACVLALARAGGVGYSVSMLLAKARAPNAASLGATNGLVQFAMCFARAVAPALASAAFAVSVERGLLGGHAWVGAMLAVCAGGWLLARQLART